MDLLVKLFEMFADGAKKLSVYLPQSGDDVLKLLKQLFNIAANLNVWIMRNIGVDIQLILKNIGKIAVEWLTLLFGVLKALVERL